jgi:hypothetical protein
MIVKRWEAIAVHVVFALSLTALVLIWLRDHQV